MVSGSSVSVRLRRGIPVYERNPFLERSEVPVKERRVYNKTGDMALVNRSSGEIRAEFAGFCEVHEVDSAKFVKLFVQGVKALTELSGSGTRVFELLYLRMQDAIGKDRVYMGFSEVEQAVTPMSERTYLRGMSELIEKGFLAATTSQGLYWINPAYLWNGDRLAFVKEYRRTAFPKPATVNNQPPLFPDENVDALVPSDSDF